MNSGINGDQGETGPQGENGKQGLQGLKGESVRGEKGSDGSTGLPGPQGLTGHRGENGASGQKGEMGRQGEMGMVGRTGNNGDKGKVFSKFFYLKFKAIIYSYKYEVFSMLFFFSISLNFIQRFTLVRISGIISLYLIKSSSFPSRFSTSVIMSFCNEKPSRSNR